MPRTRSKRPKMASNTSIPSGYDYEFVHVVPDDNFCSICHLVMRNPVQTKCGHQFCKECLQEANKRNPQCPEDREPLTAKDIFEDKAMKRRILSVTIKCPEQACTWQGELGDIENHYSKCDHKIVDCDNKSCSIRKPRCEMVGHVQDECQYRIVSCPHCKNDYTFYKLKGHTSKCPQCPVSCPNNCGKTMKRQQVTSHKSTECPLTIVPCSYQNIGCTFTVQRKLLNDHIDNHVKQHLDIAMEKIVSIQNQTTNAIEGMQNQMDDMKKQIPSTKTIEDIQNQMNGMKNQMDDVHYSYVWKVKDFSQQLEIAKQSGSDIQFHSEPFYTHKYGYKLKLRLYPNGEGDSKGTHISLFLFVMRGDYDAMLTWPFDWKYKYILLDQKPNPSQQRDIENPVTPDKSTTSFQKPTTNENLGYGYPQFVSHKTLATEKYVVDGTVFLKVELEKP